MVLKNMSKNYSFIIFLSFFLGSLLHEAPAQEAPSGSGQNYSLNPANLGSLQNSVSPYTGQVSFPMTVASLAGRGGLAPEIVINYNSSGVKQMVNTWNREAPTGILGLGWSLEFPRVICDLNQTGTRHDDTFYLVEGGSSNVMVCTDDDHSGANGYRTYEVKSYQPWKIKYYYLQEKWVIEKGDGASYVYGDTGRSREDGTIQYMISWGNWIGDSKETSGQSELPYIWNLSEVSNLWDDKLQYTYANIEEEVGVLSNPGYSNNPRHTKASVLKRITGPTGNFLELNYEMKVYEPCLDANDFRCTDNKRREYQDPHVEQTEPDAYQEKFETRYLNNIQAYNEDETFLYDVNFEYEEDEWIGDGEMTKRVLTGIQKVNYNEKALPKTEFKYFKDDLLKGYVETVTNSIGGNIKYSYVTTPKVVDEHCEVVGGKRHCFEIGIGTKKLLVTAPESGFSVEMYTEPQLFFGPDYVVVIWRRAVLRHGKDSGTTVGSPFYHISEPMPSFVQVYNWEGEWVKHDLGYIGNIRLSDHLEKHELVANLQRDHFSLLFREGTNEYKINLFHKTVGKSGWNYFSENVLLYDGRVADAQYLTELFLTSGPDHVAFANLKSEYIYIYTWRGNNWIKQTVTHNSPTGYAFTGSSNYLIAHNTRTHDGSGNDQFWMHYKRESGIWVEKTFPGGFNAAGMFSDYKREKRSFWHGAPGFALAMANDNPEYIFSWDTDYDNITKESLLVTGDYYPVYWRSNGFFHINNRTEDNFAGNTIAKFFSFNGLTWSSYSYEGKYPGLTFATNPHKMIKGGQNMVGISYGDSEISLGRYDINNEEWINFGITTSEPRFDRYIHLLPGAALMAKGIYFLEPDGSWLKVNEISVEKHLHDSWKFDLRVGINTIYSSIPYGKTEINKLKNGLVEKHFINYNMDSRQKYYPVGENMTGNDMFAAFPPLSGNKYGATEFHLYKWSDDGFQGGHEAVVVSSLQVNDGNLDLGKYYEYNYQTARMDPSGTFPLFNEVKITNGGKNIAANPRGYTKSFFYNGKKLFDLPNVPSDQSSDFSSLFSGNQYRSEIYNSVDELVFSSETVFEGFEKSLYNSYSQYARPVKAKSTEFLDSGTKSMVTNTTYNSFGLPTEIEKLSNEVEGLAALKDVTTFTYLTNGYYFPDHYLLNEVIATKKSINEEVVSSNFTTWALINNIPQPVSSYGWLGFGSSTFTSWSGGNIDEQWRLQSTTLLRDTKGNILESQDFIGDFEAAIYDAKQRNPVASASYSKHNQLAATSFEPGQSGNWTYASNGLDESEAFTGTHSFNQTATASGLPLGEYILYYWYKNGACNITVSGGSVTGEEDFMTNKGWTLRKVKIKVTGTGTVSLMPGGLIDEVRIYPEGAYVTTHVFDSMERKVAETGPGMRTTHFYYDDLDRQQYITDHEDNIVKYYEYGFKNYAE